MQKFKKLFVFAVILFSVSILITAYTYAAEIPNSTQNVSTNSIIGEKVDIVTLQTGSLFGSVNGNKIKLDSNISNTDKQMLVPAKFITKVLGGKYEWNTKSKTITITKKDIKIIYQLDKKFATINGKKIDLDNAPISIKNIILVPAKITSESLGAKFEWSKKLKTSTIKLSIKTIHFPDIYLEGSIRSQIKKQSGTLLLSDVTNIDFLDLKGSEIINLSGLQYMTGLRGINLHKTSVSDLTPLSELRNLKYLYLPDNKIKDITPLKNLSNLMELDLSNNQINDASVLTELGSLKTIKLWDCESIDQLIKINQAAKTITNTVIKLGMTELDKELALHDYLVTHTKYDKENYDKHTILKEDHDAYGVLINGLGVCDGYAEAMEVLLNMCGIECTVVLGDTLGPKDPGYENYGHAWNIVKIDGYYHQLDVTFDDPTFNSKDTSSTGSKDKLVHTYFNLSDKQIALTHIWDRNKYPTCNIDNDNFNYTLEENKDTIITDSWIYKIFNDNLYRFNPDGKNVEKICNDNLNYITLLNDNIFYLNKDDNSKVYRIKTDGSDRTKITDEFSLFPYAFNDSIFYINKDSSQIIKTQPDGSNKSQISVNICTSYFNIYDSWLYYRAFDWGVSSRLYKVKTDFSERMTIINEPLTGYELSDDERHISFYYGSFEKMTKDWIYYISKNNGNKIFKVKTDGNEKTQINDANSSEIEVLNDWVYYLNNSDNKYYRVKNDGIGTAELVG